MDTAEPVGHDPYEGRDRPAGTDPRCRTIRPMIDQTATYPIDLGFLPDDAAIPDPAHPGLLRAGDRAAAPYGREGVEVHRCTATDLVQSPDPDVDLLGAGFDTVDLEPLTELQSVLSRIRAAGAISDDDAVSIRAALDGAVLGCVSGVTLNVLHIADEGLFMRTAGPNRMALVPDHSNGMNDHGPATSVHADQDVFGTPMRQLMEGRAPTLFRHDSPDGHNRDASLMMLNLWIPLQQITQPLVLGDGRTIDRPRHQLRYGLPTGTFLERDGEMSINDIWAFLPDPNQHWFFRSEMDHRVAYAFDTLSTPHGAGVLPGEPVAEQCSRALEAAEAASERGDVDGATAAVSGLADVSAPADATPALREAIEDMLAIAAQLGGTSPDSARSTALVSDWVARSNTARRRVVRLSIELRLVVSVTGG